MSDDNLLLAAVDTIQALARRRQTMNTKSDSVDSREGQLQENKRVGADRRNCEARQTGDGEKVKRPLHDSSLLSQYFWGSDDDEMESRPPDRKRKCRGYPKKRASAAVAAADPAAAMQQQDAAETSARSNWHDLPMELLVRILSLVDNRTVITASGVCHGWRHSVGQGIHDLSFSWCGHSVNKLLHSVAPKFPRLQNCRLKRCTHLDDAAIQTASTSWHELKALELCEGRRLTDASLYALASGCPMLEKLDFSGCSNITETGLVALIKNCHNLRHLNLWGCYDAGTDSALQALAKHCKALQSLNLGWCGQVTDKGILALARGCGDLRVIDLCRCSLITDQSVIVLADKCHNLSALGVSTCSNLTDRAMYTLIKPKALQAARGKRNRFSVKNLDMASDFQVPRHNSSSSCSSSGSTCSDASKLPIKREGLDTLLEEHANQLGNLVCLNVSHCGALSAHAVQAVCDAFPDLHTCTEQHSLVTSGCVNLTSVKCVCAVEALRDKSKRDRRLLFAA